VFGENIYKSRFIAVNMSKLKIIVGIVFILIGLALLFISLDGIIWGIILIIIGIAFIVFRKGEEDIEERQDLNNRKTK